LAINRVTAVGAVAVWTATVGYCRQNASNQRNGQDDGNIVETSEPFTITRAALNRHIISSADYNWLKPGPANQPGGHLSANLSCSECSGKYFEEFQVS